MDPLKNGLAELYNSEYPKIDRGSRKRLRLNKAVAGSFEKRLKIISEAIEELKPKYPNIGTNCWDHAYENNSPEVYRSV